MLMKTPSQSIAERIRSCLLAPGARLPSVRQCAEQQGVSVSTVVTAYDQLQAQGLVEARKNTCCDWPASTIFILPKMTPTRLVPDHATRLCALDGLQRTIYASGFSKLLARRLPGVRAKTWTGYAVSPGLS